MNPLAWKTEHLLALVLAALIGAVLGVVVGYIVYAIGSDASGSSGFDYWVRRPMRGGVHWGLGGAVIGAAMAYVRRLLAS